MQKFEVKTKKDGFSQQLIELILSGKLKAGDRIPPERELAEMYGISRGSVNQGILDLERVGLIRIVPRKGAFVADYMKNANPETLSVIMSYDAELLESSLFRDLMDMRTLVECECVRLACRNRDENALTQLHERTEAIFKADESEIGDALYLFHRTLVAISGNSVYAMIFQSFENMMRSLICVHYSSRRELYTDLPLYSELASAVILGDAETAEPLMRQLLSNASSYLNKYLSQREAGYGK